MPKDKQNGSIANDNISIKPEIIMDDSKMILSDIGYYLAYIRQEIRLILIDDDLHYSEPMDKKKIYPAFTYTQFLYILLRLYDKVYSVRYELLCIDDYHPPISPTNNKPMHNLYKYSIPKVEMAYDVYYRLCVSYGYICGVEPFYTMTGIDEATTRDWLSCGRSNLVNTMLKNAKSATINRFDNSSVPILNLAAANYRYRLNTESDAAKEEEMISDSLPDLLALPSAKKPGNLSLIDGQSAKSKI